MPNTENNLLHTLTVPQLGDAAYGQGINELVNNINSNFQKIITAEFLRGPEGRSIELHTYPVTTDPDNNNETYCVEIFNAVIEGLDEDVYAGLTPDSVKGNVVDENGREVIPNISLIYETNGSETSLISSLPFVYTDPRFYDLNNEDIDFEDIEDCSCIVQYSDGAFRRVSTFPTLYYDANVSQFCWKLNGVRTGLISRGPKGEPGNNGHIYIVKVDNSVNTGVQNKYKVTPFITDDVNNFNNVNNGDFTFVAKLVESTVDGVTTSNYEYYIGLLKVENDNVYAIINDDSIYNQFTGYNFTEYLKHLDIDSTTYPKGLFIPINSTSAHIICANALSDVNNNGNNDKLNMNILPVASLDSMNSSKVKVIRKVGLSFDPYSASCPINRDTVYDVIFFTRITSKTALSQQFDQYAYNILKTTTGEERENTAGYPEDINVYYFKNENGTVHVFSGNLNIYSSDLLYVVHNEDGEILSHRDFDIVYKYNHTYLLDETGTKGLENTSLNFGYENMNIGVDDMGASDNMRKSTLNVKGDIIATSTVTTETVKADISRFNTVEGLDVDNVNIKNPIIENPQIQGDMHANSNIIFNDKLEVNGDGISANDLDINGNIININGISRSSNNSLNINIPTNISGQVSIECGNTRFYISDKTISNYSWGETNVHITTVNKPLDGGGSITGASNTSSRWRKHVDAISKSWTLQWKDIGSAYYTDIAFKPLVIGFTYQGRSYRNGKTTSPAFTYKVHNVRVEWDECSGTSTFTKYSGEVDGVWTNNLKKSFADNDSGSTYTDYIVVYLPNIITSPGTYINRVKVYVSAVMDGDNASGVWTTVGDININKLQVGQSHYAGNTLVIHNNISSISTSSISNFMRIKKYTELSGTRTVVCTDGLIIGKNASEYGSFRWSDTDKCIVASKFKN